MKKLAFLLSFPLLLLACKSIQVVQTPAAPVEVTLLQINDVYEIAPIEDGKVGGMARVRTLERELSAVNPNTYLVLAGDFLSPSVIGTVKMEGERVQGAQMVEVMNQTGVDWVVFGNHEFDLKENALLKRIEEAQFSWIGGNVLHQLDDQAVPFQQRGKPLPRYAIWKFSNAQGQDLRIGVLGVCLDANPQPFVTYEEVFQSALKDYETLRDSVDFCIALTHLALEQDQELARRIPALQLIMGGHEHERHQETVGQTFIAKADANARSAWVHQLTWDGQSVQRQSVLRELDESIALDTAVTRTVKAWETKAYAAFEAQGLNLKATVTVLTEPLNGLEKDIRSGPTNLGIALAQSMFEAAQDADCGIVNSGSVRLDDMLSGKVTEFDLIRALPFGGSVLKVDMKGELLLQVLAAGQKNRGTGGYLQYYGLSQQAGQWRIGTDQVDPNRVYRVAITDFLMTGLEANLDFLTRDNPQVQAVIQPGTESLLRDIRLVLADFLKKQ